MRLQELWARLVEAENGAKQHAARIQNQKSVIAALIKKGKSTDQAHQILLNYERAQDHRLADIEAIKDALERFSTKGDGAALNFGSLLTNVQ
jgi:hypothetical protein